MMRSGCNPSSATLMILSCIYFETGSRLINKTAIRFVFDLLNLPAIGDIPKFTIFAIQYGRLTEWLGSGLQNRLRRFESATDLNFKPYRCNESA
jgi:hypothetical protein